MESLKIAIFAEVRNCHEKAVGLTDEQLNQLIFHHNNGLRLTFHGFLMIKKIFTAYSFEMPETLKARHHFGMSLLLYPYFVTSKRLVLFSEMDAMTVKLCGGIERFLENQYQSKMEDRQHG